jgi:hypothetical protein
MFACRHKSPSGFNRTNILRRPRGRLRPPEKTLQFPGIFDQAAKSAIEFSLTSRCRSSFHICLTLPTQFGVSLRRSFFFFLAIPINSFARPIACPCHEPQAKKKLFYFATRIF